MNFSEHPVRRRFSDATPRAFAAHSAALAAAFLLTASPSSASTLGSSGVGLWDLSATFVPGEGGAKSTTVPASGVAGNIPRADDGALTFNGGVAANNPNQASVQAVGSFAHWTPEPEVTTFTDEHYGIFPITPQGTFTDNGGLAVGNGVISFRFDFDIDYFVDGNGLGAVPIGFALDYFGVMPEGYRANFTFEATWSDTTSAENPAANATISDTAVVENLFGSGVSKAFSDTLSDTDTFGPIVDPEFGDAFNVTGYYEITIDKLDENAVANPEDDVFVIRVDPDVGDWVQDPDIVPEPSTYAVFLGACALGLVMLRRRRS
jgi:hypothetical protein